MVGVRGGARIPLACEVVVRPRRAETLHQRMAEIISRVAQHACRQGEASTRQWPPLHQLPMRESWRDVGEQYAEEALAALLIGIDDG